MVWRKVKINELQVAYWIARGVAVRPSGQPTRPVRYRVFGRLLQRA